MGTGPKEYMIPQKEAKHAQEQDHQIRQVNEVQSESDTDRKQQEQKPFGCTPGKRKDLLVFFRIAIIVDHRRCQIKTKHPQEKHDRLQRFNFVAGGKEISQYHQKGKDAGDFGLDLNIA